jgi:hypothetical protein
MAGGQRSKKKKENQTQLDRMTIFYQKIKDFWCKMGGTRHEQA